MSIFIPNNDPIIPQGHFAPQALVTTANGGVKWEISDKRVTVSFLDRSGNLPPVSGLNWGQREGRQPNEAYLPLRGTSNKAGFLPPNASRFTLKTDDGKSLDCVRGQATGKAIGTYENNSILGEYFRGRLGLPLGSFVNKADLETYGRTNYTIEKIDGGTFLLDFSVR